MMKNITWFYPENSKDAVERIKTQEALPHGGGTHLTGKRLHGNFKLLDLGKLDLCFVKKEDDRVRIGSMTDYHTVASEMNKLRPGHILFKSLGHAATTPLRNQITIGGSLYLAPNWSDLTGPLLALNAEVKLEGKASGIYPVKEYLENKALRKQSLITEISIPEIPWESWYYREARVKNDQPAFTISILIQKEKEWVKDLAIVITGHTGRFMRANSIEEYLRNKPLDQLKLEGIGNELEVKFATPHHGSSEYLQHTLAVQLERGLTELLKS